MWSERSLPRLVITVGALIPALVKIELGFDLIGMDVRAFIEPLHHTFFQQKEPVLRKRLLSGPLGGVPAGVDHSDNPWVALVLLCLAALAYVLQNRSRSAA